MTNIVQEFKNFMQEGKLSDEDAQKMFALFKKTNAEKEGALNTVTTVPSVDLPTKPADQTAASEQTTVEKPETATSGASKEFTMEELGKLIADKIAEHDAQKADSKAKEQTSFNPIIENDRVNKPRYRVLKMN